MRKIGLLLIFSLCIFQMNYAQSSQDNTSANNENVCHEITRSQLMAHPWVRILDTDSFVSVINFTDSLLYEHVELIYPSGKRRTIAISMKYYLDDNYQEEIFELDKVGKSEKGKVLIIQNEISSLGNTIEITNADTLRLTSIPCAGEMGGPGTMCYTKYNGYISGMGMKTSGGAGRTSGTDSHFSSTTGSSDSSNRGRRLSSDSTSGPSSTGE